MWEKSALFTFQMQNKTLKVDYQSIYDGYVKENCWSRVCEVLELFNSLLEPKVVTKDEQTPLKIIQMDFKINLETTTGKKVVEMLDLLMELDDQKYKRTN